MDFVRTVLLSLVFFFFYFCKVLCHILVFSLVDPPRHGMANGRSATTDLCEEKCRPGNRKYSKYILHTHTIHTLLIHINNVCVYVLLVATFVFRLVDCSASVCGHVRFMCESVYFYDARTVLTFCAFNKLNEAKNCNIEVS